MSLKDCRLKSGKSVMEVARFMGVTDTCVYQWENHKTQPRVAKLTKLANFYDCPVEKLLQEENKQ